MPRTIVFDQKTAADWCERARNHALHSELVERWHREPAAAAEAALEQAIIHKLVDRAGIYPVLYLFDDFSGRLYEFEVEVVVPPTTAFRIVR